MSIFLIISVICFCLAGIFYLLGAAYVTAQDRWYDLPLFFGVIAGILLGFVSLLWTLFELIPVVEACS